MNYRSHQTAYDIRNRVAQINHAGPLTSQVFDAVGNLTTTQDPNGNPTSHQYDSLNRLLQTVDALSGTTLYGYDRNDKLTQVTAPNGANTTYEQDDLGNQLKEQSPDRGTLAYAHDEAGNVKTITDARNITTNYSYDALNRITAIDYPGTDEDITLTFDSYTGCANGLGRLCKVQDQSGTTEYTYDGHGTVSQIVRTMLGITYVIKYSYDAVNRTITITYPDGRTVVYTRDVIGRIAQVSMVKDGVTMVLASNITYRADGLPKSIVYGNGLTEQRTYNLKGELTDQTLGSSAFNYTYDLSGNLTQAIRASGTSLYAYDALDCLIQEASATVGNLAYSYDPNGNRLSFLDNGETKNYSYSLNTNRLTQIGHKDVVLDAAGNTTSKDNGKWKYEYGQAGRLFKAYKERKWVATYLYNAQGQRTQKTTRHGTTVYHYDLAGHLIAETTAHGDLIRAYVWLDNLPLVQIDVKGHHDDKGKDKRRNKAKEHLAYLHTDHLGTPRAGTDQNGKVVWRWEGTAFGDTPPNEDPDGDGKTTTINIGWPGTYRDKETGLYLNGARYFDPKIGRTLTPDRMSVAWHVERWQANMGSPNRLPLEINPYVLVANNPLRWIDSNGMFVTGEYNRKTGQLRMYDIDSGRYVSIGAESGGRPFGDALPPGTYDILERGGRPDFYRLDPMDQIRYNDVHESTGRDHFRLHRPGRTVGCIAAKDWDEWRQLDELIQNTLNTDMVPDNFKPWWKFWPTKQQYLKRYGQIIVR